MQAVALFTTIIRAHSIHTFLVPKVIPHTLLPWFPEQCQKSFGGRSGWLSWLSVWLLISAHAKILRFVRSSPASGSADSAELAWDSLPLFLSLLPPPLVLSLCVSPKTVNKLKKIIWKWTYDYHLLLCHIKPLKKLFSNKKNTIPRAQNRKDNLKNFKI